MLGAFPGASGIGERLVNLRYMALRLLIRLSDFIEIGICALRPEPMPVSPLEKQLPKQTFISKKDESLCYVQYLETCFDLDD